jgi:hypothetical protein
MKETIVYIHPYFADQTIEKQLIKTDLIFL